MSVILYIFDLSNASIKTGSKLNFLNLRIYSCSRIRGSLSWRLCNLHLLYL